MSEWYDIEFDCNERRSWSIWILVALDRCARKIDMLTRWGGGRFGSENLKIVVTRFGISFELEE